MCVSQQTKMITHFRVHSKDIMSLPKAIDVLKNIKHLELTGYWDDEEQGEALLRKHGLARSLKIDGKVRFKPNDPVFILIELYGLGFPMDLVRSKFMPTLFKKYVPIPKVIWLDTMQFMPDSVYKEMFRMHCSHPKSDENMLEDLKRAFKVRRHKQNHSLLFYVVKTQQKAHISTNNNTKKKKKKKKNGDIHRTITPSQGTGMDSPR